jgi:hypothetical protein
MFKRKFKGQRPPILKFSKSDFTPEFIVTEIRKHYTWLNQVLYAPLSNIELITIYSQSKARIRTDYRYNINIRKFL